MQVGEDHRVIVAGGTANVGYFVVKALLERGVAVIVPSRSSRKLEDLREALDASPVRLQLSNLHTIKGDFGDQRGSEMMQERIVDDVGQPTGVVAALGNFITTPSLLEAEKEDLESVLQSYVTAHFMAARTFVPLLSKSGGTYIFLQGPLAFELHPEFGTDLISVATAAQHMLFRSVAQGLEESEVQVVELIPHTLIRDRKDQLGSSVSGEEVGAYAANLLVGAEDVHGESIVLRDSRQLIESGPM